MNLNFHSDSQTSWRYHAQQQVKPILEQIMQLPFIRALADGSLTQEQFFFYLQQDVLYLHHYSQIMQMIADRCPLSTDAEQFRRFSTETIKAEQCLQQDLLQNQITIHQQTPSCLLYSAYLYQQLATQPLPVAIASTLACFYVYQQVGEQLLARTDIHVNPYHRWIEAYNCPEYRLDGEIAMSIADRLATQSSAEISQAMLNAFLTAAKMEWQLWHSCWHMDSWAL